MELADQDGSASKRSIPPLEVSDAQSKSKASEMNKMSVLNARRVSNIS